MDEVQEYKAYLATLTKNDLLRLQYEVKRNKEPEKHQLITEAFSDRLSDESKRSEVAKWIISLPQTYIVVRDYSEPVKIVSAKMNSRGNAAIIQLEGETHVRYISYKG